MAGIACGGESAAVGAGGGGATGTGGNGGASSGSAGAAGDTSGTAGSSNGGAAGSNGSSGAGGENSPDASSGTGGTGSTVKDASTGGDAPSVIRDAASERVAVDGACTEGTTDRCDTCTDAKCCTQIDACETNAACKAAFAKIDACIGDSGSLARIRNCYTAFEQVNGAQATARNLAQCVASRCTNQCRL